MTAKDKRNFVILAKTLQSIGNEANFDDKEDYMQPLSAEAPFAITKCKRIFDDITRGSVYFSQEIKLKKSRLKNIRSNSKALLSILQDHFQIFVDFVKKNPEYELEFKELQFALFGASENSVITNDYKFNWNKIQRRRDYYKDQLRFIEEMNGELGSKRIASLLSLSNSNEFSSLSCISESSSPSSRSKLDYYDPLPSSRSQSLQDTSMRQALILSSCHSTSEEPSEKYSDGKCVVKVKCSKKVANFPIDILTDFSDFQAMVSKKFDLAGKMFHVLAVDGVVGKSITDDDQWSIVLDENGNDRNGTLCYTLVLMNC